MATVAAHTHWSEEHIRNTLSLAEVYAYDHHRLVVNGLSTRYPAASGDVLGELESMVAKALKLDAGGLRKADA